MDYAAIVRDAVAHVEANLPEPLSLSEVAAAVHVSPYHFHRVFLASMGEPLMACMRRRRLQYAAAALSERGRSIQDIALDCAFSDISHVGDGGTMNIGVR